MVISMWGVRSEWWEGGVRGGRVAGGGGESEGRGVGEGWVE